MKFRHLGRLLILSLLFIASLDAQISQASLKGAVKDTTGASIAGAAITLKDKGTGSQRTTTSNASGESTLR